MKRMKFKRLVGIVLSAMMIFSLIGCGESTETDNNASDVQGSRSNPYAVGDTITISEIEQNNIKYSFTFTVDEVYSRDDWTEQTTFPIARARFQLDGENDDAITYTLSPVTITAITVGMENSNYFPVSVESDEQLYQFYTGVEYNVYLIGEWASDYKYCSLKYTENNEEHTIYISLD